jgi:hypothetical protein
MIAPLKDLAIEPGGFAIAVHANVDANELNRNALGSSVLDEQV